MIRALRIAFLYAFWPFYRVFFYLYFFTPPRYKRLRIGSCSFWGPPAFLDLCAKSVAELKRLDKEVYQRLLARRILFYSFPRRQDQIFSRTFSIADAWCSWKVPGVISYLVYVCFVTDPDSDDAFLTFEPQRMAKKYDAVKARVQFWIAKAGFADELIRVFE